MTLNARQLGGCIFCNVNMQPLYRLGGFALVFISYVLAQTKTYGLNMSKVHKPNSRCC
jgi:hypothetical protein